MKDLTKGYSAKVIMMFAIPLIFGQIMQQFYNMADSKIVSTYVGTGALAAVGATAVVSNTLIGFMNGLTQGLSILVAHSFGAKDDKRMRQFVAGMMVITAGAAVFLTIIGVAFIGPILELLNTPADILPDALAYVRIILAGVIFSALYNMSANILRAVGDSKTPLYCLLIAVVINIGLDLLFVCGFHWGIEDAALATIISQAMSGTMCAGIILKKFHGILPQKEDWKPEPGQYGNLFSTGISMALMGCIVNIGTITLQGAINSLGTDYVAAHTAGRRVFDVLVVALFTVGMAMTTYTSQNMGAGDAKRVSRGVRHSIFIVWGMAVAVQVIWFAFGKGIIVWLTHTDNEVIMEAAQLYMNVSGWFLYILGPLFILRCTLQGMGRKIIPLVSSFVEMMIKVLSASFLVPVFGYIGVAFTEPISWVVMIIPLIVAYVGKPPEKMLGGK